MTSYSNNDTLTSRDLTQLCDGQFDVLIIGGGITGAWLALHCVQQGYKTALIERGDYASQTSSASSKLLHGGIRYLQQFQFYKVRESALERAEYVYAAPHLSTPVPFIVPTYPDFKRSKFFLKCGMLAYSTLCLGEDSLIDAKSETLPKSYAISPNQLNEICDLTHESHTGGVVFYERHMLDSERMVLAILQTARKLGACIYNHVSADGFLGTDSQVSGVNATDQLTGHEFKIQSTLTINAAGPFVDSLNSVLKNAKNAPKIDGFAVGSHIITRQICDHAIAITTKHQSNAKIDRGGRHVFAIPWRGYSLIGTSYDETDCADSDLSITSDHVEQLLDAINEGMPNVKLTRDDIISGYSGLYPLHTDNIKSTVYQGSGEYQITDHETANGVTGLITALGAKYTTGRKVSALTSALIAQKFSDTARIEKTKLDGSQFSCFKTFINNKVKQYQSRYSETTIKHLAMLYGSNLDDFISRIDGQDALKATICASQPDIFGQVIWAIEREQAHTLQDILYRRTSLGLLGIQPDELPPIADLMAERLGWSNEHTQAQLQACLDQLKATSTAIQGQQ